MWVDSRSGCFWYELCRMPLEAAKALAEGVEGAKLDFAPATPFGGPLRAEGASNRYFAHRLGEGVECNPCPGGIRAPYPG